jgi:geranylgeranyl diphosphate/geranylgeranyl-bacteriochlorophyllide a reductase
MQRVAIIGGGPAGSMAAETLARGGVQVAVFEERAGWEKPCGGGLPPRALARYPFLLDALDEHKRVEDVEMVAATGASVRFRLRRPLVVYSRATLNQLLLRRAADAGAEIVSDRILDFQRQGSGWRLEGREASYAADFLILAAGARSRLRGLLAGHFAARDFMVTFGYYAPGASDLLRVQFFEDFEGYAWAFPRPDHLSLGICGKVGESDLQGLKARLHDFIRQHGYDEASMRAPVFSHLLPALSAESWYNLRLVGPGWALAGDAAGLVDPVTGEGIAFAMRSGELLAASLLAGAPESYPERVWWDFGRTLALGARMARFFYRDHFWGKHPSTRLVEFSLRSRSFKELFEDLIEGSQSYPGLALRMYRTLAVSLGELALGAVRREWSEVSGRGQAASEPVPQDHRGRRDRQDREVRKDGRFQGRTRQYAQ